MNGYTEYGFSDLGGGLNLRDKVDALDPRYAIDCAEVVYTTRGAVEQRVGYAKFTDSAGTNFYDSLFAFHNTDSGDPRILLAGAGNRLEALKADGTVLHSSSSPTAAPHRFVRIGTPTSEAVYIANGTDQVRKYTVAAGFSTPGSIGTYSFLANWDGGGDSNRMVGARTATNKSRVFFSQIDDPEDFTDGYTVDLFEGDGEEIKGMCTWSNFLFVFKETRIFVFYSETAGITGEPEFNYRILNNSVGLSAPQALCVARDGVYFFNASGIYRTDGTTVEEVSDVIDPIFLGDSSAYYQGGELAHSAQSKVRLAYFREQVYVAFPAQGSSTNNRLLVYDPRYDWWALHEIAASDLCPFVINSQEELLFAYPSGSKDIGRYGSTAYASDNMETDGTGGTAVIPRWNSGWFDADSMDAKHIVSAKCWGAGTVQIGINKDFQQSGATFASLDFSETGSSDTWGDGSDPSDKWGDGTSSSDVWGGGSTRPPIAEQITRDIGRRGTFFSLALKNTLQNNRWSIHRINLQLDGPRNPSVTKSDQ